MNAFLFVLLLLISSAVHAQEPVCGFSAKLAESPARHATISDPDIVLPFLAKFNAIDPVSDYKADTIFLVDQPRGMVNIIFSLHDCVVGSIAMPQTAVRYLLKSLGENA